MDKNKIHLDNATNPGQLHRAIALAEKMYVGRSWDGCSHIYFHHPGSVAEALREFQLTGELNVPKEIFVVDR